MNDLNSIKLKKCPFCGGDARVKSREDMMIDNGVYYIAYCRNSRCYCNPLVFGSTAETAAERWNTRYIEPEPEENSGDEMPGDEVSGDEVSGDGE